MALQNSNFTVESALLGQIPILLNVLYRICYSVFHTLVKHLILFPLFENCMRNRLTDLVRMDTQDGYARWRVWEYILSKWTEFDWKNFLVINHHESWNLSFINQVQSSSTHPDVHRLQTLSIKSSFRCHFTIGLSAAFALKHRLSKGFKG